MAGRFSPLRIVIMRIVLATCILFVLSLTGGHAEENIPSESSLESSASSEAPQHFQGFDLAGYGEGGQKSWDIKGDTADIVGNLIKLTNIIANAYGEEKMNLTAKNGTLDKISGNMHLEDDVVITTDTGAKLLTDSLDWEKEKDLVRTEDEVTIIREDMTAVGTGAKAQPSLSTAQMNKDVTVNLNTEPKSPQGRMMTITCDGPLEIDYQKQIAVFNTNVVAVDVGRKLQADRMELFFDKATNKIKEVVCIGNVVINQGENTSYSDRAVYKAGEQKILLSGRPKLIFYTEEKGGLSFDSFSMPSSGSEKDSEKKEAE